MNFNTALGMLRNAIKDDGLHNKACKDLRIERWLRSHFSTLANLNEEKWLFVAKIFSYPSCWNGIKLDREIVGLRFVEENPEEGIRNPLNIYDRFYFACKYCITDKIPCLFREVFTQFKTEMTFNAKHDDTYKREELLRDLRRSSAVEYFWSTCLDTVSGELKDYASVEKFKEVVRINYKTRWGEGIEFFYNRLQHNQSIQDCLIEIVLSVSKDYIYTDIVEFCILKMDNEQKEKLLLRDYKENNGHILFALVDQYHFRTFCGLLDHLNVSCFNYEEYGKLIASLARKLISYPDLAVQTKETLMLLWRHRKLKEFKKDVYKDYDIIYAIAALIVDLRDDPTNEKKQSEILEILQHPDQEGVNEVRKPLLKIMVRLYGIGEEQYKKDVELIEQLFSKINKCVVKQGEHGSGNVCNKVSAYRNQPSTFNKQEGTNTKHFIA